MRRCGPTYPHPHVTYRLTIRSTGNVDTITAPTLAEALDTLEELARAAAAAPTASTVDLRARRWTPEEQIATRIELKGPQRWRPTTRAGLDVRGDGSLQAWTGAPERAVLEPQDGEDAYAALRRALARDVTA
jgi:hypothetical protein